MAVCASVVVAATASGGSAGAGGQLCQADRQLQARGGNLRANPEKRQTVLCISPMPRKCHSLSYIAGDDRMDGLWSSAGTAGGGRGNLTGLSFVSHHHCRLQLHSIERAVSFSIFFSISRFLPLIIMYGLFGGGRTKSSGSLKAANLLPISVSFSTFTRVLSPSGRNIFFFCVPAEIMGE